LYYDLKYVDFQQNNVYKDLVKILLKCLF